MVSGFANQASLALELTEARVEQQRAAMADDRERIAADLHDHVIQRLFAAGLSLHRVAKQLGPGTAAGERTWTRPSARSAPPSSSSTATPQPSPRGYAAECSTYSPT